MKVLVLAPHPDDEINVAGSRIISLVRSGAEVFVAYSTDGDFDQPADLRAREAIESLKILGVDRDHIVWLGYGDTFNGKGKPHVFYAREKTRSPAGFDRTYAPNGFEPFNRSDYTRENFFRDLERLILELRADIIFCVDLDFHADHRALSLAFEKVMGEILKREDYRPLVCKKLAYATAFTARQDFHSSNLLSTPRPTSELEAFDFDPIDRFNYVWNERVRFPMPLDCREPLLKKNPLARAIFAHRSQRIQWNALAILNADEIFFERRTDSLTFKASVEASSGEPNFVRDFQMLDLIDINESPPRLGNYFWTPDKDDPDRKIIFRWDEPQSIKRIKIYGTLDGKIDKLRISLDNITTLECRIERGGRPTTIDLDRPIEAGRAEFSIVDPIVEGGIGEIEIFSSIVSTAEPFIKITHNDNFIYDYFVPSEVDFIDLSVYKFNFDGEIKIDVDGGKIERIDDKDNIRLKLIEKKIRVRAAGEKVSDEILIERASPMHFRRLKLKQFLERIYIHWIRKKF